MTQDAQHKQRLIEIAETTFGTLSDDEVLRLLAERKQLAELEREYGKLQEEQEKLSAAEQKKAEVEKQLADLNVRITPDKADEDLLALIKERQALEGELSVTEAEIGSLKHEKKLTAQGTKKEKEKPSAQPADATLSVQEEEAAPSAVVVGETPDTPEAPVVETEGAGLSQGTSGDDFGQETIVRENSELHRYLDQLRSNRGSLGTLLDSMSASAKKNKDFMLAVAKIDPAYAMHYADKNTLKKDEDFNLQVAGMPNDRHSGNVLSEMLPEARTAKVVLAATKRDYHNVRFALPNMEGYEDILTLAKKAALEKIKELKDGVDVSLLIPKVLQKDKTFMAEVAKIAPQA